MKKNTESCYLINYNSYTCVNFKKTKKMKKITLFAAVIVAISFASCKKDRVCSCTNSSTGGSVTTSETTYTKIKKSEAKTLCQKTTYTDNLTGYVSTSDCKLK